MNAMFFILIVREYTAVNLAEAKLYLDRLRRRRRDRPPAISVGAIDRLRRKSVSVWRGEAHGGHSGLDMC